MTGETTSTATGVEKMKSNGRVRGQQIYSKKDINILLELVSSHTMNGKNVLSRVAAHYTECANKNIQSTRDVEGILQVIVSVPNPPREQTA